MKVFRIVFERNPIDFEIVPLYDIHFGTIFHDKKLFNKVIDYIKNNDNTYCFLGGDIIEGINIGDKRFDYDSLDKEFKKNVNNIISFSIEYTIEKLSPIKDKILFAINGNHDRYMYGKFGVDIIGTICKELGIKNYTTDYECFAKLLFKHQKTYSLDIYAHHGHGSAPVRSGTLLNRLEDAMINFDANLYAMGHTHQVVFTYKNHLKMNSTGTGIVKSKKWLIRVGGFRFSRSNKAMGYEEKFGLRPNATGTVIIKIEKINRDNSLELSIKTFC